MTARDRTVLLVVVSLAIVAAAWFLLITPVRSDAKALDDQVAAAQLRLTSAQAAVGAGETAEQTYRKDYAGVARLGKAVPAEDDVPSLVVQLDGAAKRSRVDFRSIELATSGGGAAALPTTGAQVAAPSAEQDGGATGASGASGATGTTGPSAAFAAANQAAAAALPPGTVVGAAGFPTMPFKFKFNGSFFRLQDFLERLDRFTEIDGTKVTVRGRLLTVDGFSLAASTKGFPDITADITATAYLLPAEQGLLAGANPLSPGAIPPAVPGAVPSATASNPSAAGAPVPAAAVPTGGPTP